MGAKLLKEKLAVSFIFKSGAQKRGENT